VIVSGDEASLYLQASLKRVWAPVGVTPVVKADPGRDNTHFYGALNLHSGKEVVLCSDLMNAEVSALFLQRLLRAYPDCPILLLWDRAPWHRGPAIRAVLEANPRLEIVWFPPGSPELNPQEHVWKATREAVSHNHTRTQLPALAAAFEEHLTTERFACSLLQKHGYDLLCTMFK
jgi:transposase